MLSCGQALQKYDRERDEAQAKRLAAAAWGVESKDDVPSSPPNGRKQTMTQQDIMRNYAK